MTHKCNTTTNLQTTIKVLQNAFISKHIKFKSIIFFALTFLQLVLSAHSISKIWTKIHLHLEYIANIITIRCKNWNLQIQRIYCFFTPRRIYIIWFVHSTFTLKIKSCLHIKIIYQWNFSYHTYMVSYAAAKGIIKVTRQNCPIKTSTYSKSYALGIIAA